MPRGIQGEKSREKIRQVRLNWSQQLERKLVPKRMTEPGFRKGKRSLLKLIFCHFALGATVSLFLSNSAIYGHST